MRTRALVMRESSPLMTERLHALVVASGSSHVIGVHGGSASESEISHEPKGHI